MELQENETRYFWVRFWPTAPWEITKFWKEKGRIWIKGLDWMLASQLKDFKNTTYELGQEIMDMNKS
jgi:hypothetical protein